MEPTLLANYRDFSAGNWGAAGAHNGNKGSWGGRNVILTRAGAIAPVSASRALIFSNMRKGAIVGQHWAWGIDGRYYFIQQIAATQEGVLLGGGSGTFVDTPDSNAWNVAGTIRIAARITAVDYTAAAEQSILAHYVTAGNMRSFWFGLDTTGALELVLSSAGTADNIDQLSSAPGFLDGTTYWVGVQFVTGTGAITFYKHADQEQMPALFSEWTQISTHSPAATVPYASSTATLEVGATDGGTLKRFTGVIYRVAFVDDGVTIANPDFSPTGAPLAVAGALTYTDSASQVWTMRGLAAIRGDGPAGQYQVRRFMVPLDDLTSTITIEAVGSPIVTITRPVDWFEFSGKVYLTVYGDKTYEINPTGPAMAKLTGAPGDAPGGRALVVHGERLMIAGVADARLGTVGNRVCYSEPADIGNFPTDNFFDAGADTSEIGALAEMSDTLIIVFGDQQMWTFRGVPGGASNLRRVYGFHQGSGGTEGFGPHDCAVDPSQTRLLLRDHATRGLALFSGSQYARVAGFGVTSQERGTVNDVSGGVLAIGGPNEVFVDQVPVPRTEGDSAAGDNLELIKVNGVFSLVEREVVAGSA